MNTLKKHISKVLYQLGIRTLLPAQVINDIPIKDNNEPLVNINTHKSFFWGENLIHQPQVLLRHSVFVKLLEAEQLLPENYYFKIYSAYRSIAEQTALWNKRYQEFQILNPNLSTQELTSKVRKFCADPRQGFGGHQTGGALDIGLCDKNGIDYPMGTQQSEISSKTISSASILTLKEKQNRDILITVLKQVGFVNYPNEWWHFCYGDRMWAAYSNKKTAFYGLVA